MTDAGTELRVGFKVQLVGLVLKRVDRVHMARRKPPSRDETQKRRFLRKTSSRAVSSDVFLSPQGFLESTKNQPLDKHNHATIRHPT
ncbi:hypothetical protein KCU60_g48, partial [Aureobasidium melanogenum]